MVLTLTELITNRFDQLTPEEIRHQCELANEAIGHGMNLLDHLLSWGKAQGKDLFLLLLFQYPKNSICLILYIV